MVENLDTQLAQPPEVEQVCQRYRAALRSGDTVDDLEHWVGLVASQYRDQLRKRLREAQNEVSVSSVETRVLSSDAILANSSVNGSIHDIIAQSDAISGCRTFRGLSRAAIDDLRVELVQASFEAGSILLQQGSPACGLILIHSGTVDIIDSSTGERIDCDGAGSVLGEMSLLTGASCTAGVIAMTDVEAQVLSIDGYRRLIEKHPELELALSQLVSDRLGGRSHDALCGKIIGGYQIVRCLNRGGMGVVYEATDESSGERVALKMLRHRFIYDDLMQMRFEQEAQLLTHLRHPNVVHFRKSFVAYRTRFLVLDLCDGSDLYRLLSVHGRFSAELAKGVLGQIALGLQAAHQAGVIHRDLKPGNILVDRSGLVRITDFGLSRLLESDGVEPKAVGTPAYMPPEQFRSDEAHRASDWYAFGCLAYELLTGAILFQGRDWGVLYDRKLLAKPSANWPNVDAEPEVIRIIRESLQPNLQHRFLDLEYVSQWAKAVPELFAKC